MENDAKLIELYEMISLNDAALGGGEKTAILQARRALAIFEQAIETFKRCSTEGASAAEANYLLAA